MPPTIDETIAVRREAFGGGDDASLLSDLDIDWYWDHGGGESVLLTAAMCCEMLAARIGGSMNAVVSASGVSVNRGSRPGELRKRAAELRRRYLSGDSLLAGSASTAVRAVWTDHTDTWATAEDEFSDA